MVKIRSLIMRIAFLLAFVASAAFAQAPKEAKGPPKGPPSMPVKAVAAKLAPAVDEVRIPTKLTGVSGDVDRVAKRGALLVRLDHVP